MVLNDPGEPQQPEQPDPSEETLDFYQDESGRPYVYGRNLVPIRRHPGPNFRVQRLLDEADELRAEIRELDQQMLELSARRQELLARARRLHDETYPTYAQCRGRRRRRVSQEAPLPPVGRQALPVIGRELRALCLVFLRQAQTPLTLRELHAQLHRAGYVIAHPHPTKALADALGHESDAHRCHRVRRGVYALVGATADPPIESRTALPDW